MRLSGTFWSGECSNGGLFNSTNVHVKLVGMDMLWWWHAEMATMFLRVITYDEA